MFRICREHTKVVSELKQQTADGRATQMNPYNRVAIDVASNNCKQKHAIVYEHISNLIVSSRTGRSKNHDNIVTLFVALIHRAVSKEWTDEIWMELTDWFTTATARNVNKRLVEKFNFGMHWRYYDKMVMAHLDKRTLNDPFSHLKEHEFQAAGSIYVFGKDNHQLSLFEMFIVNLTLLDIFSQARKNRFLFVPLVEISRKISEEAQVFGISITNLMHLDTLS